MNQIGQTSTRLGSIAIVLLASWGVVPDTQASQSAAVPQVERRVGNPDSEGTVQVSTLSAQIQYELLALTDYDVFDWLEAEVFENGHVVLSGEVTRVVTRNQAERRVREIEGTQSVANEIEILPASPSDDRLRTQVYRAIYNQSSPLFRYSTRIVPPIHIIVDFGRVTLKGTVSAQVDRQYAYAAARGVTGVIDVTNEVELRRPEASLLPREESDG
jgi:hyperosmotically inducible protein